MVSGTDIFVLFRSAGQRCGWMADLDSRSFICVLVFIYSCVYFAICMYCDNQVGGCLDDAMELSLTFY